MRISIFLVFISIQAVGFFSDIKFAFGNDLQVSLENEVAGITPGMTLLPKATGNINQPASQTTGPEKTGTHPKDEPKFNIPDDIYQRAGFISNKITPVGKVAKIFDNKLGTSGPEKVFINLGRRQGLELGDKFIAYSQEKFINHPVLDKRRNFLDILYRERKPGFGTEKFWMPQGKPMGYRTDIRGVLEVIEVGETSSAALIIKAYEDIKPDEFLMPYREMIEPSVNGQGKSIDGYVVATQQDRIIVGLTDVVYIDKGWVDGVSAGQIFEVYHIPEKVVKPWYQVRSFGLKRTPMLPDVLGEIKILNTQRHTATAVIVQSHLDMQVGHKIRIKR
ncbi:MAG: hypothetical protein F3743_10185 [Nitrospinae bacterium]|nr:hypothetical protein [Nitrospinota bacterium]